MLRLLLVGVTVLAAILGAVPTASAATAAGAGPTSVGTSRARLAGQIIFDRGNDIWAANADGSHAHPLVTAKSLGLDALGDPATSPAGDVLLFTGWTNRNRVVSRHDVTFYGKNWHGTYELHDGRVQRLTPAPRMIPASADPPGDTSDLTPEPTADGHSYVYAHVQCTEYLVIGTDPGGHGGVWDRSCRSSLRIAPLGVSTSHSTKFATLCDDDEASLPSGPTPDPASAGLRVAYAGCESQPDPSDIWASQNGVLMLSGPAHHDQVTIANTAESRNFADPAFSPDGRHLVAYNEGGEYTTWSDDGTPTVTEVPGGLYVYDDLTGTSKGRLLVRARQTGSNAFGATYAPLTSPRYLGGDTIAFVRNGSIYTVPASCSGCDSSSATLLHKGGAGAATKSFSLTWTTKRIAPSTSKQHKSAVSLAKVAHQRLTTLLQRGLTAYATCASACKLKLRLTVSAGFARHHHLVGKHRYQQLRADHARVVIGHRTLRLHAGRGTDVTVTLTGKARRKLRHVAHVSLRLTATSEPGGSSASAARKVHAS